MTENITKAMVEDYSHEHDCSITQAMQALKQRQKLARHAQMLSELEAATTVDELKLVLKYVMGQLLV